MQPLGSIPVAVFSYGRVVTVGIRSSNLITANSAQYEMKATYVDILDLKNTQDVFDLPVLGGKKY